MCVTELDRRGVVCNGLCFVSDDWRRIISSFCGWTGPRKIWTGMGNMAIMGGRFWRLGKWKRYIYPEV